MYEILLDTKTGYVDKIPYNSGNAKERFAKSLRETGFGVLTDHPIPHDLIFSVFQEWERFFNSEKKHKYTFNAADQSGYFPFRSENAKGYSIKDLKEFFHLFRWTQIPEGFSDQTWTLFHSLFNLSKELLSWIEDETPEEIRKSFSMPLPQMIEDCKETLLRILHYPPLTGQEEAGAIRAAAHEDINLITLLPTSTAPGLQALDLHGNWHDVECNPGDIVVNVGDMLQMASKRYYSSTTHRVINPKDSNAHRSRFSMPLFLHARADVQLSANHTALSYLNERLREIGLKKA